jgi:hypothetical protein
MKRFSQSALILFVVFLVALITPTAALAAPAAGAVRGPASDIAIGDIVALVIQYASLAGFAALVAVLINIFKTFGIVKDGEAGKWSAALNLIGLVTLIVIKVFVPALAVTAIDGYAGQIAQVFIVVLGFVIQIVTSAGTHDAFASAGLPVIGKSHSTG